MTLAESLLEELTHEAQGTRNMLERVPFDKLGWQPHFKSMTLGRLAAHISEIPGWLFETIKQDELDFTKADYSPKPLEEPGALLEAFDDNLGKGISALKDATDAHMLAPWALRNGDEIIFRMARIGVVRGMVLNHIVHHRGQLSVYLRLLDIHVPGMYGPSADDME